MHPGWSLCTQELGIYSDTKRRDEELARTLKSEFGEDGLGRQPYRGRDHLRTVSIADRADLLFVMARGTALTRLDGVAEDETCNQTRPEKTKREKKEMWLGMAIRGERVEHAYAQHDHGVGKN